MIDPAQEAIQKGRERANIVTDEASGINPSDPDPFQGTKPRIPVPYNAQVSARSDSAFDYQPLSGPGATSLHQALSPDKQAEIAEAMLRQQLQQNDERFKREMDKEEQSITRSRMFVFTGLRILRWVVLVFLMAFIGIVLVLGLTGWKAGSLSDVSVLTGILNFFGQAIAALVSNSSL